MSIKKGFKKVVYTVVVGDLFHFGHLKFLHFARSLGDYLICGVMSDDAAEAHMRRPIANLEDRMGIFSNLGFVDRVIPQFSKDPIENLRNIHQEFNQAEIVVVYGSNWKAIVSQEYIASIGGRVVRYPSYYDKLSDYNIMRYLLSQHDSEFKNHIEFLDYFKLGQFFQEETHRGEKFPLSTKANTLLALQPLLKKSSVEQMIIFTESEWETGPDALIWKIRDTFSHDTVIVRSSSFHEDTLHASMAGAFESILDVNADDPEAIKEAVAKVIASYHIAGLSQPNNQILIQKQCEDVLISGVIFTREIETNAPYYVINYDVTGKTDAVTGGLESKSIKIYRFTDPQNYPDFLKSLKESVKEIEEIISHISLDIEFAIKKNGQVVIFQVRPLSVNAAHDYIENIKTKKRVNELHKEFQDIIKRRAHLAGDVTCLTDMSDWNPAEIIGNYPNYLDYSLYDYIITDNVWHKARTSQGYYDVNPAKLVVMFGSKPYVDVRNSFNSFIPADIGRNLREKLVNFYVAKLKTSPALQDKIEFDVVFSCFDFTFDKRMIELKRAGFQDDEIDVLKNSLVTLTNNLVTGAGNSIRDDLASVRNMGLAREKIRERVKNSDHDPILPLRCAKELLDRCMQDGTLQFSRLARLAFIGKILLKSMRENNIIGRQFYDNFLNSISTVAKQMSTDFILLQAGTMKKGVFMHKYGHLRPGSYDITSPRYDNNPRILEGMVTVTEKLRSSESAFVIDSDISSKITHVLSKAGLKFDSAALFYFIKTSLEARELAKFEFTKNLSDAIECIALGGSRFGFSRDDMSHMDLDNIFVVLDMSDTEKLAEAWRHIIEHRKKEKAMDRMVALPPVILSENDLEIVIPYTAKPNFITRRKIYGSVVNFSDAENKNNTNIRNKIVVLENGDPGYDWIFTREPLGLITKYGGVASHMSIRCAEFGLPAAIGCGDVIFDKLKKAKFVSLDCADGKITPHYI